MQRTGGLKTSYSIHPDWVSEHKSNIKFKGRKWKPWPWEFPGARVWTPKMEAVHKLKYTTTNDTYGNWQEGMPTIANVSQLPVNSSNVKVNDRGALSNLGYKDMFSNTQGEWCNGNYNTPEARWDQGEKTYSNLQGAWARMGQDTYRVTHEPGKWVHGVVSHVDPVVESSGLQTTFQDNERGRHRIQETWKDPRWSDEMRARAMYDPRNRDPVERRVPTWNADDVYNTKYPTPSVSAAVERTIEPFPKQPMSQPEVHKFRNMHTIGNYMTPDDYY